MTGKASGTLDFQRIKRAYIIFPKEFERFYHRAVGAVTADPPKNSRRLQNRLYCKRGYRYSTIAHRCVMFMVYNQVIEDFAFTSQTGRACRQYADCFRTVRGKKIRKRDMPESSQIRTPKRPSLESKARRDFPGLKYLPSSNMPYVGGYIFL